MERPVEVTNSSIRLNTSPSCLVSGVTKSGRICRFMLNSDRNTGNDRVFARTTTRSRLASVNNRQQTSSDSDDGKLSQQANLENGRCDLCSPFASKDQSRLLYRSSSFPLRVCFKSTKQGSEFLSETSSDPQLDEFLFFAFRESPVD